MSGLGHKFIAGSNLWLVYWKILMLHLCWNRTVFVSFTVPPYFKMAGNSFKQRYFGSLSTRLPYLPPQVWCKKEKCSRDNLRWNFLDRDSFVELQETKKSNNTNLHLKNNQFFGPQSLYSFRNFLKHCMFWTLVQFATRLVWQIAL